MITEVEAIQRAALLAQEAGAKLHIVHISSGRGVIAALEAKARGADVSIETCPHYLFFTEEDLERLQALIKCAPPLRTASIQEELWRHVLNGAIEVIASDHSPAPPDMKSGDFSKAWGGIAGVQSTLAILLELGYFQRGLQLERIAELLAGMPARRFRIADKGGIAAGQHADITLVDLNAAAILAKDDLQQRYPLNPYVGTTFRGAIRQTIRRGETIFRQGRITAQTPGRLVRPE